MSTINLILALLLHTHTNTLGLFETLKNFKNHKEAGRSKDSIDGLII